MAHNILSTGELSWFKSIFVRNEQPTSKKIGTDMVVEYHLNTEGLNFLERPWIFTEISLNKNLYPTVISVISLITAIVALCMS